MVSHLLYADDLLGFASGDLRSFRMLLRTLEKYENWPGQLISNEKLALYFSKHINLAQRRDLLQHSGFVEGTFPATYLGVPLVSSRLTARSIEPLVKKIHDKVASRKVRLLSQAGCLILLKHVLSCMATHLLAMLNVPMVFLKKINSILSTFF